MKQKIFIGAFNKKNNFCERNWVYEKWGLEYTFDPFLFSKVADKITQVLGHKTKYTVQDAYRYFHISYHAYQIDYRQFYNYCNTHIAKYLDFTEATISNDTDIELLAEESGRYFSYLADGQFTKEKVLTLVIDNSNLRDWSDTTSNDNLIMVIGSFDETTINSMKVILSPNFAETEYALEFFRLHS